KDVPEELDRVVMKALAKKAEERYQTAEEMLLDLNAVRTALSDEQGQRSINLPSTHKPPPSALLTINEKLGRPRLSIRFLLLALLVFVLAAWGVWKLTRWPGLPKPSKEAEEWYKKGTAALRDGAYYGASRMLGRSVKADDKFALAHARLAEAWMELDYGDKAKDELLRVSTLIPERSVLPRRDALYLDAINGVATRDFATAIESYRLLVKETPDSSPDKPQLYVDLGRAYEKNEETGKAIENYLKAINLDPQYATAYLRLGILYSRNQDTSSANAAYEKADALFQSVGNTEGHTEVLYRRGILAKTANNLTEAQSLLQQALDSARANDHESQQINSLLELSRLAYNEGSLAKAQQLAQEALDFAQQRGLVTLVASGFRDRAWVFYGGGDYVAAEKDFNQALDLARRNRASYLEATILYGLGSLQIQMLEADKGLENVKQALRTFQEGSYKKNVLLSLSAITRGHRRQGDYQAALEAIQEKLKLSQQANDQREVAFSYADIAAILFEQEQYPQALDQYNKSYEITMSLGDKLVTAYNLMNRSNVLWRLGRYNEAETSLSQASELAKEGKYKQVLAEIQTINAQIALSQRRFPDAKTIASQAIESAGTDYKELAFDAQTTLCLAQTLSNAARDGRQLCQQVLSTATKLGDSWRLSQALLALARAQLESNDAQGALANALQAQGRFKSAGQQDSEWQAWVVAALASRRQNDEHAAQQQLAQASEVLSQLRQKWDANNFNSYLQRPDIQLSHKQLGGGIVAAVIQTSLSQRRQSK
ncbi:MAG TPA: tetratricopeptide repeat protein, partial [Pyrinomonadaceae bacterium]